MSGAVTATVEVLTAEVRTLMVGSRQITLSVAKQLDRAPLAEVDVFGRIRLADEGNAVIGRHQRTGALVRSSYVDAMNASTVQANTLPQGIRVCQGLRPYGDSCINLSVSDEDYHFRIEAFAGEVTVVDCASFSDHPAVNLDVYQHANHRWMYNEAIRDALDQIKAKRKAEFVAHAAAAKAPLIVLAGLR